MQQNIDDVAFTRTLLDDLSTVARIDQDHVHAAGMSNGAMMAYRLASELSNRIAASAPVGGPMGAAGFTIQQRARPSRAGRSGLKGWRVWRRRPTAVAWPSL